MGQKGGLATKLGGQATLATAPPPWPPATLGLRTLGHPTSSSPPIYSGGFLGAEHTSLLPPSVQPRLSYSSISVVLSEALSDHHAAPPPPRRRAAAGALPQPLLPPCWIKVLETSSGCTCVERGGTVVRCLDRNRPRSESLRVRLHQPRSCNASALRSSKV